jgi:ABC-2 type transport system ATP-binding protein
VEFALGPESAGGKPLDDEALRTLDGVRAVRRLAGGYELQVSALHRTVPALLALLARGNLELAHLTTHSATLEDVFVSLTGRQLRDE